MGRFALSLARMIGATAICLVLAEVVLRFTFPQPASWLAIYRGDPELGHALQSNATARVSTGETDWTLWTDDRGFRVSLGSKGNRGCHVLWLGDSFAFGHGVDYDETFVGIAQARSPEKALCNAAVPGYGPIHYRKLAHRLLGSEPDVRQIWVAIYVGNDFHDSLELKRHPVNEGVLGHRGDLNSVLKTRLDLYRLTASVYHRFARRSEGPYQRMKNQLATLEAWEQPPLHRSVAAFYDEMQKLQGLAGAADVALTVLIIPTRDAVDHARGDLLKPGLDAGLPVARARKILRALGIRHLDGTRSLATQDSAESYFEFDGHLTPRGHKLLAAELEAQ